MREIDDCGYIHAWRVIEDLSKVKLDRSTEVLVHINCHLSKEKIKEIMQEYKISDFLLKRYKGSFLLWFIPSPNVLVFSLDNTRHLLEIAKACDEYLFFEILIFRKNHNFDEKLFEKIYSHETDGGILSNLDEFILGVDDYFFCGFDFDAQDSSTGVTRAIQFNKLPSPILYYLE